VVPGVQRVFPQGKFVKVQVISSLCIFRNTSNVLIICVMTNFPWGKRGEGKRGRGRGKDLCAYFAMKMFFLHLRSLNNRNAKLW